MNRYTIDYFIDKFRAIPEDRWCVDVHNDEQGRSCALGHCGKTNYADTEEAVELMMIFINSNNVDVAAINDNKRLLFQHLGATPKTRVLEALRRIKNGERV